jgi:putative PIN family toxin of toxin-antitoxin system
MKPRVVFDCMVFLQGAGRPAGPARACFHLVDKERVTLCLSAEILAEVRDVLTPPKVLRKFPQLSPEWVTTFLQDVEAKALVLSGVPQAIALERDPKDEPYLNLAVAAKAHYLVSRDLDLLDLMKDEDFKGRFPDLLILDPVAFLKEIARQEQAEAGAAEGPETSPEGTQEQTPGPAAEAEWADEESAP